VIVAVPAAFTTQMNQPPRHGVSGRNCQVRFHRKVFPGGNRARCCRQCVPFTSGTRGPQKVALILAQLLVLTFGSHREDGNVTSMCGTKRCGLRPSYLQCHAPRKRGIQYPLCYRLNSCRARIDVPGLLDRPLSRATTILRIKR
jgi:hypothetical protein